jgi:hypothetical protein
MISSKNSLFVNDIEYVKIIKLFSITNYNCYLFKNILEIFIGYQKIKTTQTILKADLLISFLHYNKVFGMLLSSLSNVI